uniref:Uncharacterized protein n=1 Tax=Cryptococcus bacillisporus CA1280 TaxID=1296109 RepID=A0A0D0UDU0_CRYGA|nr:hypothetical protein I312_04530 [Cryptococcus bacillisporus CA1280]
MSLVTVTPKRLCWQVNMSSSRSLFVSKSKSWAS